MGKFLLKTVIIDDEVVSILELIDLLNIFFSINIIGTATNLDEGIELIKFTQPKIVFLDMDMHNKSGLDIFNEFESPDFKIIFLSSKKQITIRSLEKPSCEYLSKPFDLIKLEKSLQKVHEELLIDQDQLLAKYLNSQYTNGLQWYCHLQ